MHCDYRLTRISLMTVALTRPVSQAWQTLRRPFAASDTGQSDFEG